MKSFLLLVAGLISISSCKTPSHHENHHGRDHAKWGEIKCFAQSTPNRDTLYLNKDDSMSYTILKIWKTDTVYSGPMPEIVLVSGRKMEKIKNRIEHECKEEPTKKE